MTQLVVSEEQAQLIVKAVGPVEVRDTKGNVLGVLSHAPDDESPGDIAELKRRARTPGKVHSTEEVLRHLQSLEAR
jgi:hypothetical protein